MKGQIKYQIRIADDEWETAKKAEEQPSGWLHYELRDGTNGLAQPKNWRKAATLKRAKDAGL